MSATESTENQDINPEVEAAAQATDAVSIESLQARIAELEAEVADVKARANADMYNFQKRVERETELAKKFALEKFATSLLDVVDNLERAIGASG